MSGWIDRNGWIHCPTCGNKTRTKVNAEKNTSWMCRDKTLYYQSQTPRRRADNLQDKSCGLSAFTFDLWLGSAN